jgi:hypothetical protein
MGHRLTAGFPMADSTNKNGFLVGVDFGGTKILGGIFDSSLQLLGSTKKCFNGLTHRYYSEIAESHGKGMMGRGIMNSLRRSVASCPCQPCPCRCGDPLF